MHETALLDVVDAQALPRGQGVQLAAPLRLKEPAAQGITTAVLVLGQAEPAGQVVQLLALPAAYCPDMHGAFWLPSAAGQAQPAGQA